MIARTQARRRRLIASGGYGLSPACSPRPAWRCCCMQPIECRPLPAARFGEELRNLDRLNIPHHQSRKWENLLQVHLLEEVKLFATSLAMRHRMILIAPNSCI